MAAPPNYLGAITEIRILVSLNSEWRWSVRLLYSDTCRKLYACNSSIADVGDQSRQQPHCAGKLPSARESP
jgi:hypothetical protein